MKNKLLARIIYYTMSLLSKTYRYKYYNTKNLEEAKKIGKIPGAYFMALWHQNIVATIYAHNGIKHSVLVSPSKDGELVAFLLKKLGHISIRGSSHRQYFSAMKELLTTMSDLKIPSAITVDAPKGPPFIVKRGIVDLAKHSQVCILPIYSIASKFWCFQKAWDKFRLPWPFSTIYVYYGSPLLVAQNLDLCDYESITSQIKVQLDNLESLHMKK